MAPTNIELEGEDKSKIASKEQAKKEDSIKVEAQKDASKAETKEEKKLENTPEKK